MRHRELAVTGAFEFVPETFPDDRGAFVSTFQEAAFAEAVGHPLFPVAQASQSTSKRGVVRGVHYTLAPPGTAKYVYCTRGRALDMVVDLRVGSPTFGRWDQVELAGDTCRSVYLPPGVGHAFAALDDDTVVCYLLSREYRKKNELAVSVFDAEIGLRLPSGRDPILSERDMLAPTVSGAAERGMLPRYEACLAVEKGFGRP
ncbi:dTDP-4-dehydrorhamnose 3,5-epimerase family protein [Sphaerisporangium sp. NBC_01403]|uniref:dTDP-4-dehydrorhamnose 3,5-epimerase family protein n=1 Tax=Sphaerisporangium sp. NBC_01403 TaxID=2903599 RepID=UPI003255F96B